MEEKKDSSKIHAIELSFFTFAMPDDGTESLAKFNSKRQPSIICMPQLQASKSSVLPRTRTHTSQARETSYH